MYFVMGIIALHQFCNVVYACKYVYTNWVSISLLYYENNYMYIYLLCFQYPKGLGNTVKELDVEHASCLVSKTKFSMLVDDVVKKLPTVCGGNLAHVVLFGIEVGTVSQVKCIFCEGNK